MKTNQTPMPITSSLTGTIVRIETNGYPFIENAHARCILWTRNVCYVRLL